jgi:Xaa-Pro aminopeptidase
LRERLADAQVIVSYDVPLEPRLVKDTGEVALLERASRAAEAAVARGAALLEPGRTEREIADAIAGALRETEEGTSDVAGLCIGPQHNRAMHHEPRAVPLPEHGPVRLGVLGRVEGYWVLITRMAVLGEDASFEEAYGRYVDVYEAGLADLHAGAEPRALYEDCRDRAADAGFTLETLKTGHGTGLDFRERPWLAPWDDLALMPGMVLAYDYGLVSREDVVLHLEDRVLVEASGPRRLSSGWMLRDLRCGHVTPLGAHGCDA